MYDTFINCEWIGTVEDVIIVKNVIKKKNWLTYQTFNNALAQHKYNTLCFLDKFWKLVILQQFYDTLRFWFAQEFFVKNNDWMYTNIILFAAARSVDHCPLYGLVWVASSQLIILCIQLMYIDYYAFHEYTQIRQISTFRFGRSFKLHT